MSTPEPPPHEQTPPPLPPQGYAPYGYGTPAPGGYYGPPAPTDGMAVAALVVGILGLVGLCGYGLGAIISPVALFLGRSSMKRIDASEGRLAGRGLAQAGFIMGIVGTVLFVLSVLVIGGFLVAMFSTDCFGDGC